MKSVFKNIIIFCIGFTIYQSIEGIFKMVVPNMGAESFLMGIIGGLALLLIGGINNKLSWNMPIWLQSIIGGVCILGTEFIMGLILNKWLCPLLNKPLIWDYSNFPGNIMGQICPQFFIAWILLGATCIVVDDYLRYFLFNEEKPHYCWKF
jgi:uncharacterized membrane protein